MNAHIINVSDENLFRETFLPQGYLGVGIPAIADRDVRQLKRACRTSYNMYADMKTIRSGDILFVHVGGKIYGAFQAAGEFRENPEVPWQFHSRHIHYNSDPHGQDPGWCQSLDELHELPELGCYRRLPIQHFVDSDQNNLCFERGFEAAEVFDLKAKGRLWTVPERWQYSSASRTIRPIMEYEARELLRLLSRENSDTPTRLMIVPANLAADLPIEFILNPSLANDEKIIEGWILDNMGRHEDLDHALGRFTSFGNNLPAGYLKLMDIFGYQQLVTGARKYAVVEVKLGDCTFPRDIKQLIGYADWVTSNVAEGDYRSVDAVIIAREFTEEAVAFARSLNEIARRMRLIKYDFHPPGYDRLIVSRVV